MVNLPEARRDVPLCVDLDGTLLKSDLLYESLLSLILRNPLYVFLMPFWLLAGKAGFKRAVASRVDLQPLPLWRASRPRSSSGAQKRHSSSGLELRRRAVPVVQSA